MKKISVAIPTYNTSKFINECISPLLNIEFIDEIVISDDCSDPADYEKLNSIVESIKGKTKKNLILTRNKKNLGGLKNKYFAISNCKNDIVYQLDSDNIVKKNSLSYMNKIINTSFEDNTLYLPGCIYIFKQKRKLQNIFNYGLMRLVEEDVVLDRESIKKNIVKSNLTLKEVSWILNLGNPIFHKETYLEFLKNANEDSKVYHACSIAMSYFWLTKGGNIKIISKMSHLHRIRPDSYYVEFQNEADQNVKYFVEKLSN